MTPEQIEQMKRDREAATDIPWDYVPGTEHHGPYVTTVFGSTVCDCYTISAPRYENESPRPVPFLGQYAEPNARRIARVPDLEAEVLRLREALQVCEEFFDDHADADQPSGSSPIPNREMSMLLLVRAALGKQS